MAWFEIAKFCSKGRPALTTPEMYLLQQEVVEDVGRRELSGVSFDLHADHWGTVYRTTDSMAVI